MAIKPVNADILSAQQELYQKFWTKFNYISSCNETFCDEFKVHKIASIRGYQDYSVGKSYHICIKINFQREVVSIQAYFNNMNVYDEFFNQHRDRIELKLGKHLTWKRMTTKGYALYTLNLPYQIEDIKNWDKIYEELISNALLIKKVFGDF